MVTTLMLLVSPPFFLNLNMDFRALNAGNPLFISPEHLNTPLTLILYDQL